MTYQQSAGATRGGTKGLSRLVFRCRDLPDILKFARVAAGSAAPVVCFYGTAGATYYPRPDDVVVEMGFVSAEEAIREAQAASMLCADLSLACAVDVSGEAGLAWAAPGATCRGLIQSCRDQGMTPCFAMPPLPDVAPDRLLSALRSDPTPLLRLQKVSLGGTVQWLSLRGGTKQAAIRGAGNPDAGIISRLELRLRPATISRAAAFLSPHRREESCRSPD